MSADRSAFERLRLRFLERAAVELGGTLARAARRLEARELGIARAVFGNAIRYDDVRVVQGYVVNAPTTLGNVIRIGLDGRLDDATLVHELTHVWQYQTRGTAYISDSVCSQLAGIIRTGSRRAAYAVHPRELLALASIHELSAERQARSVEHYFVSCLLRSDDPLARIRARSEFARLCDELSDPETDSARFEVEFGELTRMIAEIRGC